MIRTAILALATVLALWAGPARAVPMCDGPDFTETDLNGNYRLIESEEASRAELRLRAIGIHASNTRFWNGCLQTFVRENGHTRMRYFDFYTLDEIPVN